MEYAVVKSSLIFLSKEEKEFKNKAQETLGKRKKKISSVGLYYLKGIPYLDENKKYRNWFVYLEQYEQGFVFKITNTMEKMGWVFSLAEKEVEKIYFVDGEEIAKQKSVIGRSIGGALIAGPVGAIIGGLSGLGEVKKQDKYMIIETKESKIIFNCTAGTYSLARDFKVVFKEKVITTQDLKIQQEEELLKKI